MNIAVTLAWRYLWGRKLRTLLTTLAVVFGVAIIFGLNSLMPTITETFTRSVLSSAGQVDLTVTNASGSTFPADVAREVEHVEGVRAATPALRRSVSMPRTSPVSSLTVVGIEPRSAFKVKSYALASGRMVESSDSGAVTLGKDLADKLGVRVGSKLVIPTVNGTKSFRVIGTLNTVSVAGAGEVYMPLSEAQRMLGEGDRVSDIDGAFVTGADRTLVEQRVRRALGEDYVVGGISSGTELLASLATGQFIMNMFGVFALAMGAFIILNTFRTVVAERRRDIGMLRAVGARRRTILAIFLVESLIQGVLGTAVGVVAGIGLGYGAIAAYRPFVKEIINLDIGPTRFETGALIAAVVLGIGVTVLAALAPARTAARITPLEALRPQIGEVEERQRGRRAWIGLALLVGSVVAVFTGQAGLVGMASVGVLVGLIMVAPELVAPVSGVFSKLTAWAFKTESEIARSNMQRQPSRAATTAAAVMISLSIIIALLGTITSVFSGFNAYIEKSIGSADYVMLPSNLLLGSGSVGASELLVRAIRETPGVGDVATLRLARGKIDGVATQVIGVDPITYPKVASFDFIEGTEDDIAQLGEGRTVIANGVFASQNGLTVGERVTMSTVNGEKPYTVVAIGNDYLNAKLATVYVSQERLAEDFGTENNALVLASAKPGADKAVVFRGLQRLSGDYPQLALYQTQTFVDLQLQTFNQTLVMFYAMIAILAIPSLLAMLNNLAMSVIARTREIGMLRAVGSTRGQIKRMVLAESLLLASVGVVLGIASGMVLGYALVLAMNAVGFKGPYYFPMAGIITAVIIGFGFSVIAAIIPARSAAKLDVVSALHYE